MSEENLTGDGWQECPVCSMIRRTVPGIAGHRVLLPHRKYDGRQMVPCSGSGYSPARRGRPRKEDSPPPPPPPGIVQFIGPPSGGA